MLQDRFVKIMLVMIAVLLAANLLRPADRPFAPLESSAQAQSPSTIASSNGINRVTAIGGFRVSDLKEVVAVGDGKSFVVTNPSGFQVYRVDELSYQVAR